MNTVRATLLVAFFVMGAGCAKQDTSSNDAAASASVASIASSAKMVVVPLSGDRIAGPLLLGSGAVASDSVDSPINGDIEGAGVEIGTFGGASDGELQIDVCKDSNCVSGRKALAGANDNAYFDVGFDKPLGVVKGDHLAVKVSKVGGSKDFALWIYGAQTTLTKPDMTTVQAALNFRFATK